MHMNGNSFVYEIWEFPGVMLIKPPLHSKRDQNDEDGGIAVHFLHGLLVCGFLKISKRNSFFRLSGCSNKITAMVGVFFFHRPHELSLFLPLFFAPTSICLFHAKIPGAKPQGFPGVLAVFSLLREKFFLPYFSTARTEYRKLYSCGKIEIKWEISNSTRSLHFSH